MTKTVSAQLFRRPAMNTLFEIIISGGDDENNSAAAEAALDEIVRVETVLSRFDPASEVARVNRVAAMRSVLVSYELLNFLTACRRYSEQTFGYFDITVNSKIVGEKIHLSDVMIDPETRHVFFSRPGITLDFGAIGKGYALDCAAEILLDAGVEEAALHGGTSSVLSLGKCAVALPSSEASPMRIQLNDRALSTSGTFGTSAVSDLKNPHEHACLKHDAFCTVVGKTAAEAEVFSTALLCMGEAEAARFCSEQLPDGMSAWWSDRERSHASWRKL